MAERRMFAKTIIDSDAFLDMPLSTQALYFHLSMRADDDGFINNPKKIQRMIGASDDDARILVMKKFLIPFESGVVVIKHWKIHNYIRNDRYKETVYQEEKAMLTEKENKAYSLGIPNGYQVETQVRLGKDSIDKNSIDIISDSIEPEPAPKPKKPVKHKYGEYKNVLLTDEELQKLKTEYSDYEERIERLSSYVASTGKSYKSHYATIRNWAKKDAVQGSTRQLQGRKEIVPEWMQKKTRFNNAPERNYNMSDLENQLLGIEKPELSPEYQERVRALKEDIAKM